MEGTSLVRSIGSEAEGERSEAAGAAAGGVALVGEELEALRGGVEGSKNASRPDKAAAGLASEAAAGRSGSLFGGVEEAGPAAAAAAGARFEVPLGKRERTGRTSTRVSDLGCFVVGSGADGGSWGTGALELLSESSMEAYCCLYVLWPAIQAAFVALSVCSLCNWSWSALILIAAAWRSILAWACTFSSASS